MKKIIIANWKSNPTDGAKIKEYFEIFKGEFENDVIFCPPFVFLQNFSESKYLLGAQNCFWQDSGAFTGEISPAMLKNLGCNYVILGHSERREIFNETDEQINKKITKAIELGLNVIYCVGEKDGQDCFEVIKEQIEKGLVKTDLNKIIIAYEPVWAIGTGKACDAQTASAVKQKITEILGKEIPVLYGGSVNQENAKEFLAVMDGLLVGGASLDPESFLKICSQIN